jgi:DNA primase catalytic subunit
MRYSTLAERKEFYKNEFSIERTSDWLAKHRDPLKTVFAVVVGRHTGVFLARFKDYTKTPVLIDEYESLQEVSSTILKFLPEGVYYDRNIYRDLSECQKCSKSYGNCFGCSNCLGQELALDIDPENISCPKCGTLGEKMKRGQGLSFCEFELKEAKRQAGKLSLELEKLFKQVEVVYSGRGYHVHVFDKKASELGGDERKQLAREMKEKGYFIDAWITEGESRLIRLPYSLHGMVSRVVLPIKKEELPAFNPIADKACRPKFL